MGLGPTTNSTIYALSTGQGRAGIAIIRVSGAQARAAIHQLTGRTETVPARTVIPVKLCAEAEILDMALALWFPAPASYTGEDVLEFHVHGGRAVIDGVLGALSRIPGFRLAEPGEFTRRAFANGKLDLTRAEAIADLIDAETAAQRSQALRQMGGALGSLYESWRERLMKSLAYVEASIDFADEDLPPGLLTTVRETVQAVSDEIADHLSDGGRGEILREGVQIAIVGAPNVGKSSLLNAIAKRDVAIVSAVAGTTRDVIEVHLDLGGYPATLADTAGLRSSDDLVEQEGVRRAQTRAGAADLKLAVFDARAWPKTDVHTAGLVDEATLIVVNKSDLSPVKETAFKGHPVYVTSATMGDGVETLLAALRDRIAAICGTREAPVLTRGRHREALKQSQAALQRFNAGCEPELIAEDLRLAVRALGRITGKVDVEDMLDVIFRDFCIGK